MKKKILGHDLIKRTLSKSVCFYIILLSILLSFLIFYLRGVIVLDPDFGWHIRMGEYISHNGIPRGDPFSYTMPSFPFVDHEWLTNIGFYYGNLFLGREGLSFFFAILATISALIGFIRTPHDSKYQFPLAIIIFILVSATLSTFAGIRPQVISWFLFSLLLLILRVSRFGKRRYLYLLPLLVFLWANLHGSYPIALVVTAVTFASRFLQRLFSQGDIKSVISHIRKNNFQYLITKQELFFAFILSASIFATFLTPYRYHLWREVLQQFTNTSIRWEIAEWLPSFFYVNLPYFFLITLSSLLVYRYFRSFYFEDIALFILFLIQAITSARHVPLFLLMSIPIIVPTISLLEKDVVTTPESKSRFILSGKILLIIVAITAIGHSSLNLKNSYLFSEEKFYPKEAIRFLSSIDQSSRVFTSYGWGGYVEWKLPSKKVFIDGRMATWVWDTPPEYEESSAYETYKRVLSDEFSYRSTFNKYQIAYVLWKKEDETKLVDSAVSVVLYYIDRIKGKEKVDFNFIKQIESDEWVKVYEDDVSVIYTNKT